MPARRALAESMMHEVKVGYLPKDVKTQLERAALLAQLAVQVDRNCSAAWRVLAETAQRQERYSQAADAQKQYLRSLDGSDYEGTVQWIRLSQRTVGTSEQLEAMLRAVIAHPARSDSIRALALANVAAIEEGRGNFDSARALYARALALDANDESSARGLAGLDGEQAGPLRRAETAMALLRGNPLAIWEAWGLGLLCRTEGLHAQAVTLYGHARAVAKATGQMPSEAFRVDHLDTLLDAGLARRAAEEFADLAKRDPIDVVAAGRMVTAYRLLGETDRAEQLIRRMHEVYRMTETLGKTDGLVAGELAWFYLIYRDRPLTAAKWAEVAQATAVPSPLGRRVWAMTRLASADEGRRKEARAALEASRESDLYANVILADDAFARSDRAAGGRYLAAAVKAVRTGPTWREAVAVAKRHNASLPPMSPAAGKLTERLAAFLGEGYLQMGRHIERHLTVKLEPVPAGEGAPSPPAVRVVVTNVGELPVPLGQWGLMTPRLMLNVKMRVRSEAVATQAVPVVLPAPRYLLPGRSLRKEVRLDIGRVGDELAYRPLSRAELTVTVVADPVEHRGEFASAVPSVPIEPVRIVRESMVEIQDPDVYYDVLKGLVRHLLGADRTQAMRAAEATVSLLALVEKVKAGRTLPAGKLSRHLREPELLSMLRHCLQRSPTVVRCRTLLAMRRLKLTKLMVQLTEPSLRDESPWVRALAIERLGAHGRPADLTAALELADRDGDAFVRTMAKWVAASINRPE